MYAFLQNPKLHLFLHGGQKGSNCLVHYVSAVRHLSVRHYAITPVNKEQFLFVISLHFILVDSAVRYLAYETIFFTSICGSHFISLLLW